MFGGFASMRLRGRFSHCAVSNSLGAGREPVYAGNGEAVSRWQIGSRLASTESEAAVKFFRRHNLRSRFRDSNTRNFSTIVLYFSKSMLIRSETCLDLLVVYRLYAEGVINDL